MIFAKAIEDIANIMNVGFIDMQKEITKYFTNKNESLFTMIDPLDNLHFSQDKYKFIGHIVARELLYNSITNCLKVDSLKEIHVPIVGVPYIDTDYNYIFTNVSSDEKFDRHYIFRVNGSFGTFLRLNFYCDIAGMGLVMKGIKADVGGKVIIKDNGTAINTIDFKEHVNNTINKEDLLIQNISVGFHTIECFVSDSVNGQSSDTTKSALYFNEFIFRQPSGYYYRKETCY